MELGLALAFPLDLCALLCVRMADAEVKVSAAVAPMSVGSQVCTQCGLCCTGALHDTASVEPDEVEALRGRGMDIIVVEKLRFRLAC